jgi:hypothetical protein
MRASTQHESDNVGTRLWVASTSSPAQNLAGWHLRHCRPLVSTIRMRGVPDITQMTLLPRRSNSIKRRLAYVRSVDPVSTASTAPQRASVRRVEHDSAAPTSLHATPSTASTPCPLCQPRHSPYSGTRHATDSATRQSSIATLQARGLGALQIALLASRSTSTLGTLGDSATQLLP